MQNRTNDQALQAECSCARRGNRVFQFALKYFTAFTVMLIVILVLQDLVPAVRAHLIENPFFLNVRDYQRRR